MTRYFIPKEGPTPRPFSDADRAAVYAYHDDAKTTPLPEQYDEVQVVPVDAIVIRREDLPEVDERLDGKVGVPSIPGPEGFEYVSYAKTTVPGALKQRARALLAIAAHLREHPPVDEEQVRAMAEELVAADDDDVSYLCADDALKIARRLIESGRVRVDTP